MIRLASLALLLAAEAAVAQEATPQAPEQAPSPQARPDSAVVDAEEDGATVPPDSEPEGNAPAGDRPDLIPPDDVPAPAGEAEEAPPEDSPDLVPPDGAAEEPGAEEGGGVSPPPDADDSPPAREALAETPEELAACLADLDELGVVYESAEPIAESGNPDCGMANPLTISALAPGVALEPPSAMRCATALAGARWVADVVAPLSAKLGRGDLVAIEQGTAYLCRPRADGEMSEHAWGNALDVMGFRFSDGEALSVQPRAGDGTLDEAFQRVVRAGACLDFATVLGPGSDADHADHLHFDIKARDGGFRICE